MIITANIQTVSALRTMVLQVNLHCKSYRGKVHVGRGCKAPFSTSLNSWKDIFALQNRVTVGDGLVTSREQQI